MDPVLYLPYELFNNGVVRRSMFSFSFVQMRTTLKIETEFLEDRPRKSGPNY